MSLLPGPAQTAAICLSIALPLLLFCYSRIPALGGAGRRFRIASTTIGVLFAIACLALPGERQLDDVLSGILLLATAVLLVHVFWSLLAWGFTLTLLTSLAQSGRPLTETEWAAAYMQGANIGAFAHNRLKLLLVSGMVVSSGGKIAATASGLMVARLARLVRLAAGLG
jgi:hypothetical protein